MVIRTYWIMIDGCDDSTNFKMSLSDKEAQTIVALAQLSHKTSTYRCMPTLDIDLIADPEVPDGNG